MTKCSTRHEYADFEGRGGFCIGLKLIEVKARISAMSGGISFYIGLKPLFKQVVDTERFGYISFYIGLKFLP